MAGSNTRRQINCTNCKKRLKGRQRKYCSRDCMVAWRRKHGHVGGRPSGLTPDVKNKLVAGFHNGYSVKEACLYAKISTTSFHKWVKQDQEFADEIAAAQSHPNMNAKRVVIEAINAGDAKRASWWLEHRARDEFSKREEHTGKDGEPLIDNMSKERFDALLERTIGKAGAKSKAAPVRRKRRKDAGKKPRS